MLRNVDHLLLAEVKKMLSKHLRKENISSFQFEIRDDAPQQQNSHDCGIFIILFSIYYLIKKNFQNNSMFLTLEDNFFLIVFQNHFH